MCLDLGPISNIDDYIPIQEFARPIEITQEIVFTDDARDGNLRIPSSSQSTVLFSTRESIPAKANALDATLRRKILNNIDLNNVYDDSQDCTENLESSGAPVNMVGTESLGCPLWVRQDSHKSSPPQTSGNTGSMSTQSPSSSSEEAQVYFYFLYRC